MAVHPADFVSMKDDGGVVLVVLYSAVEVDTGLTRA